MTESVWWKACLTWCLRFFKLGYKLCEWLRTLSKWRSADLHLDNVLSHSHNLYPNLKNLKHQVKHAFHQTDSVIQVYIFRFSDDFFFTDVFAGLSIKCIALRKYCKSIAFLFFLNSNKLRHFSWIKYSFNPYS